MAVLASSWGARGTLLAVVALAAPGPFQGPSRRQAIASLKARAEVKVTLR